MPCSATGWLIGGRTGDVNEQMRGFDRSPALSPRAAAALCQGRSRAPGNVRGVATAEELFTPLSEGG